MKQKTPKDWLDKRKSMYQGGFDKNHRAPGGIKHTHLKAHKIQKNVRGT